MRSLVLLLACCCVAPLLALNVGAPAIVRSRVSAPTMLGLSPRASAKKKEMPKGVPPAIADRVSFATSGVKTANQIEEVGILWKAFKGCYGSEKLAIEAVTKNAAVLQPQLSSPTKIKGTYKQLQQRFGKAGATDIITRNPGALLCSPAGMLKQSDEEIMKAVDLVEWLDANKGPIKTFSTALYLGFVAIFAYGIVAKGHPEYGLPLITDYL